MATTTIQISQETKEELNNLKFRGETYENVISDLIEDRYVLNEETLKEIKEARKDYKNGGKTYSLEELKKEYKI
jgi:predicted CopG family antitoxin